jgi:hypothetical protein
MTRNELIQRFLTFGEIKIEPSDHFFLNQFDDFKKVITENVDEVLYYGDVGNDYSTSWGIYTCDGLIRCKMTHPISNDDIKKKIMEITKNEKWQPGNLGRSGIFNFGKYINQDIKSILKQDPDYIYWCLCNVNVKSVITNASSIEQFEENLNFAQICLDNDENIDLENIFNNSPVNQYTGLKF